jgi:hypothetical protein
MKIISLILFLMLALPALAQDHADIDKSQIIGNRELPKVLYIVPWKKPMPGDLSGRPLESVLDEALAPLDKDVFKRQVKYAQPADDKKQPAAVAESRPAAPRNDEK